jgi:hypothetical protein
MSVNKPSVSNSGQQKEKFTPLDFTIGLIVVMFMFFAVVAGLWMIMNPEVSILDAFKY